MLTKMLRKHLSTIGPIIACATLPIAASAQQNHMGNSRPTGMIADSLGKLWFAASNGTAGVELWMDDGTGLPSLASDVEPGPMSSYPANITPTPLGVFFTARTAVSERELYLLPPVGPRIGFDLRANGGPPTQRGSDPKSLVWFQNRVYFSADDGVIGRELWSCNGFNTSSFDLRAGSQGSHPYGLVVLNNLLIFAATTQLQGTELFVWNGTTMNILDVEPGPSSSTPTDMVVFSGLVYFVATTANTGRQLWRTNGTSITQVTSSTTGSQFSNPDQVTVSASRLVFTAHTSTNGRQLWFVDSGGTIRRLSNLTRGFTIRDITAGRIRVTGGGNQPVEWFTADEDGVNGRELWRTDTTCATPGSCVQLVHDASGPVPVHDPQNLIAFGPDLLFRADDGGARGIELYRTDGTTAIPLADLRTGMLDPTSGKSSFPSPLVRRTAADYRFAAEGGSDGIEMHALDPSSWNTRRVADLDTSVPLPELRLVFDPSSSMLHMNLYDAPPLQPGAFLIAPLVPPTPIVLPGLRGVLMIDLSVMVSFRTIIGVNGDASVALALPSFPVPIPLGYQAIALTGMDAADFAVASNNFTCSTSKCAQATPLGANAEANGCSNDDTGEWHITRLRRLDSLRHTTYVALARLKPSGEQLLLQNEDGTDAIWPLDLGEVLDLSGTVDFFTPVAPGDPLFMADKLQLLLFDEPPSEDGLASGRVVWQSYC